MSEIHNGTPPRAIPAEVDQLIDTFADKAGVGAGTVARRIDSKRLSAGNRAAARLEAGRQIVLVHPALLDQPRPLVRHVLAHEIAHIALNHTTRAGLLRLHLPRLMTGLLVLAVILFLATQEPQPHAAPALRVFLVLIVFAASVATLLLYWACLRRREHQADEFAAVRLDVPYNDDVFEAVTATEPATTGRWLGLLRTHPSPDRRRAHIARVLDSPRQP